MRLYTHINKTDRRVIKNMIYGGFSYSVIAKALSKDKSTISREIKRNKTKGYHDIEAQELSENRLFKRERKLDKNGCLRLLVCTLLIEKNSPEVISFYLKDLFPNDKSMQVSHESIYSWIYNQKYTDGEITVGKYLFTHRKKRKNRIKTDNNRVKDITKKNIRERPEEAEKRSEAGHIEGDLIVSTNNDAYVLTLVDRKNAYIWGLPLPCKDADTVARAVTEVFSDLPKNYVKTITFDNGTEFANHKDIENVLGCQIYFADPYCSWQRGLNEHINARIRHYLPKKKSFAYLTDEDFNSILYNINNRPRKSFGWKSPSELFKTDIVAPDT